MANVRTRIEYNRGIEGELVHEPGIGRAVGELANSAASSARNLAPVRTGAYRRSIAVTSSGSPGGSTVEATAPYAAFLEYGTNDTPAFAPIRRGVAAMGSRGIF